MPHRPRQAHTIPSRSLNRQAGRSAPALGKQRRLPGNSDGAGEIYGRDAVEGQLGDGDGGRGGWRDRAARGRCLEEKAAGRIGGVPQVRGAAMVTRGVGGRSGVGADAEGRVLLDFLQVGALAGEAAVRGSRGVSRFVGRRRLCQSPLMAAGSRRRWLLSSCRRLGLAVLAT